jgi:chromosome segregation ATPase
MNQDRLSTSSKSPIPRRADSTLCYEDRSRTRELTDSLNASEFECRRLERLANDLQCRLAVYEEYEQIHLRSREEFQQLLDQLRLMKADNLELQNRELQLQARVSELQKGKSVRELQSSDEATKRLMRQVEDYKAQHEEQRRQVEQLRAEKADLLAKYELRESFISEQMHKELGQARAEISALQSDYRSKFTKLQEELERSKRSTQDLSFRQSLGFDQETYESKIQQLEDKLKEQRDYNLTLKDQIKYLYEKTEGDTTRASPSNLRRSLSSLGSTKMIKRKASGSCRRGHRKSQG